MDNSVKAILIGASVAITLIIVTLGFFILRQGQESINLSAKQMSDINSTLSESEYTIYDGLTISGSEVVNVVKKFKDEYIGVLVITNSESTWYIHTVNITSGEGSIVSESTHSISDALDETDNQYINPNGKFQGAVVRDENGRIVAITFDQK
ncbi:hypothetical protein [Alkaliphilus serpentinus]|uniref:Cache domain-containing protein n=1 Tax=Alkaliphilus serpentinus TaxID=1482731 RepID=A0A833HL74_9FIRM|nr:hypothetical protein [Alkaliphilus serpentinus]KAB3525458.1 hypothetical protein F8153_15345 [Alkaliphilus serpentinus]